MADQAIQQTQVQPAPSPMAQVARQTAQLPQQQADLGKLTGMSSDANARAIQTKADLGAKSADYQAGLESGAANRYQQGVGQVGPMEKPKPFEAPRETLAGLAGLFSMVATMAFSGGAAMKTNGMAAMAGMVGAMKGFNEGNQQQFQNSLASYNEHLKQIAADNEAKRGQLEELQRIYATDKSQIPAKVAQYTADHQGDYTSALIDQGRISDALKYQTNLVSGSQKMLQTSAKLESDMLLAQARMANSRTIAEMHEAGADRRAAARAGGSGLFGTEGNPEWAQQNYLTYMRVYGHAPSGFIAKTIGITPPDQFTKNAVQGVQVNAAVKADSSTLTKLTNVTKQLQSNIDSLDKNSQSMLNAAKNLGLSDNPVYNLSLIKTIPYVGSQKQKAALGEYRQYYNAVINEAGKIAQLSTSAGGVPIGRLKQALDVMSETAPLSQLTQQTNALRGEGENIGLSYQSTIDGLHKRILDEAAGKDVSNPAFVENKSNSSPSASLPLTNSKGWRLFTDSSGNKAYVSPDGKNFDPVN